MPQKRILHFSITQTVGGIEAFQRNVLTHIHGEHFACDFVTTYPETAFTQQLETLGATVHHLPPQRTVIPYCIALYRLLKKGQYDTVHVHKNSCANPMAFLVSKMAGVKHIIAHAHNTAPIHKGGAYLAHFLFKPLVRRLSDTKLACSSKAADWMFGKGDSAELLQNGIDTEKFQYNLIVRAEVRREHGWENKIVFGHVGNFLPQKNHRYLVDVFQEAVKCHPEVCLVLLGGGAGIEEIVEYAKEKGVRDHVIFMGSRPDVHRFYQAMDVFLFPSYHEGLPFAGIEAQCAGLPCIFSGEIAPEVLLTDSACQLSIDLPPAGWAQKAMALAKNHLRKDGSEAVAQSGYDIAATVRKIEEIYER